VLPEELIVEYEELSLKIIVFGGPLAVGEIYASFEYCPK
jgi:hypothetical protein